MISTYVLFVKINSSQHSLQWLFKCVFVHVHQIMTLLRYPLVTSSLLPQDHPHLKYSLADQDNYPHGLAIGHYVYRLRLVALRLLHQTYPHVIDEYPLERITGYDLLLFTAGVKLSEGINYTDAALTSGFTDSAHFSNTFKNMQGMSLTSILMQPNGLELIPKLKVDTEEIVI